MKSKRFLHWEEEHIWGAYDYTPCPFKGVVLAWDEGENRAQELYIISNAGHDVVLPTIVSAQVCPEGWAHKLSELCETAFPFPWWRVPGERLIIWEMGTGVSWEYLSWQGIYIASMFLFLVWFDFMLLLSF